MADKVVSVELRVRDSLSPAFKAVGQAALAAGKTIDQAGKSVQTMDREMASASTSMSRFDQAAAKAEQTTSRLSVSAAKVGAVMGTAVSAGLLLSVKAAADAEVSQERLRASVEATGALYEQYASQISAASSTALSLSFDDEDAIDALSQLTQATGDTGKALNDLGLVMDIARGRGIDLAAAAKIVTAAEQERFGALQRLGIQIDANATRESVLADLQSKYAGQAQAYAETNAGAFDRWQNSIENWAESAGAALGPAQQLLLVFPGLAAGATMVTGAFATMGVAMGPVGIAAAAVLAAAGLYKLWDSAEGLVQPAEVANKALGELETTIRNLYATGNTLGALGERATQGIFPDLTKDIERIEEVQNAIAQTNRAIGESGGVATPKQEEDLQRWSFEIINLADKYGVLADASLGATISTLDIAGAMDDLNAILSYTGTGAAQAQIETKELFDQYDRGDISAATLIKDLDEIANSFGDYDKNATKAAASTEGMAAATDKLTEKQIALYNAMHKTTELYNKENGDGGGQNLAGEHRDIAKAIEAETKARTELAAQQMADALRNPFSGPEAIRHLRTETESYTDAINRQKQAIIDAGNAAAAAGNVRPMGQPAEMPALVNNPPIDYVGQATEALASAFDDAQRAITSTSTALDNVSRVAISNTNAVAQNSQGVMDWADNLIAAEGTYSKIDDLLQNGKISLDQYNAAQQAYNDIAEANVRVQEDVLAVQAQQAPVIAQAEQALADYWDSLAGASTDAQLFALGMSDATTASEALGLAQGYLSNQEVFGPMIKQAAELNPYLAQILEQMGLISYNPATGEVTLLGVDESQSELELLNSTMEQLNGTIAQLVAILDDRASGPLYAIQGLMGNLNGMTATTYVQTVYESVTSDQRYGAKAYGGTVSPYGYSRAAANGMTATLVGERGPEVLMLPGGAQVMNTEGSRSRWGGSAPAVVVNVTGPINGYDDFVERVTDDIAKAWQRANYQHERSMGQ